jgi:RNA polymerase sigma-70 factor (ECF subfamily)
MPRPCRGPSLPGRARGLTIEPGTGSGQALTRIFREESGKAVAALARVFGDIDIAEEAVQEAFAIASKNWDSNGIPPNPGAWLITTARNRAIDRVRRESSRADRTKEAFLLHRGGVGDEQPDDGPYGDDRLRLMFTCCHPALAPSAQVALTLRLLGGLDTPEIARAFLVPEATLAQRIVRAKKKIKEANIPYRVPDAAEMPTRLQAVLSVLYLIYNEGYTSSSLKEGEALTRDDLALEAIRLARLLARLMPDETEVMGLLALLLLTHARRAARTDPDGRMVLLPDQDRGKWDTQLIYEGLNMVLRSLDRAKSLRKMPGPYVLQAAIAAVHAVAPNAKSTDWPQILGYYDQLYAQLPTPVVALNRAVALAEVEGPEPALQAIAALELDEYHLFHAARADFLTRSGQHADARAAYQRAMELTENAAEQALLKHKIEQLQDL